MLAPEVGSQGLVALDLEFLLKPKANVEVGKMAVSLEVFLVRVAAGLLASLAGALVGVLVMVTSMVSLIVRVVTMEFEAQHRCPDLATHSQGQGHRKAHHHMNTTLAEKNAPCIACDCHWH